jgi:putative transcriptional regulator
MTLADQRTIAPGLLLAMPQLVDPNFARSVVLMVEHSHEHSFGLVVNRPVDLKVAEVLSSTGLVWGGDPKTNVFGGGPVMQRSGWLLHSGSPHARGATQLAEDLFLSTSPEELRAIAEHPPRHARFLMGYAGWGAGQLPGELAQGAWLTVDASARLVFETPHDDMWEAALRSIGIEPSTLVAAPGVH